MTNTIEATEQILFEASKRAKLKFILQVTCALLLIPALVMWAGQSAAFSALAWLIVCLFVICIFLLVTANSPARVVSDGKSISMINFLGIRRSLNFADIRYAGIIPANVRGPSHVLCLASDKKRLNIIDDLVTTEKLLAIQELVALRCEEVTSVAIKREIRIRKDDFIILTPKNKP